MSIADESLADLPTYTRWLADQDWTPAYRRHRTNLQVIGRPDAELRWVLKNPSHLFALPALLTVYPDALIVQTHREPSTTIASMSSLAAQATAGQSDLFQGEVIGSVQLDLWARGADRFMADRRRCDPAQFIDVRYDEFVADPLGAVEAIYDHFDLRLTDEARTAMASLHTESAVGNRRPSHRYDLSDFGLTADEVNERFAAHRRPYHRGRRVPVSSPIHPTPAAAKRQLALAPRPHGAQLVDDDVERHGIAFPELSPGLERQQHHVTLLGAAP